MLSGRIIHIIQGFLLLALLVFCQPSASGQPVQPPADQTAVKVRKLSTEDYKGRRDFVYKELQKQESWWDRFWSWLAEKFFGALETRGSGTLLNVILWLLAVGLLIWVIIKLAGMEGIGLFASRQVEQPISFQEESDDIHSINFAEALVKAESQKNYRLAVRLLYMQALKKLADTRRIQWQPDKPNHVFVDQMAKDPLGEEFRFLTRTYEYAWYGEFPVREHVYKFVHESFKQFLNKI